jgi:hypothetical protein
VQRFLVGHFTSLSHSRERIWLIFRGEVMLVNRYRRLQPFIKPVGSMVEIDCMLQGVKPRPHSWSWSSGTSFNTGSDDPHAACRGFWVSRTHWVGGTWLRLAAPLERRYQVRQLRLNTADSRRRRDVKPVACYGVSFPRLPFDHRQIYQ